MQFAKDSFFLALQQRLAGLNPARTITVNGATVPAVMVQENLAAIFGGAAGECFLYRMGQAKVVEGTCG